MRGLRLVLIPAVVLGAIAAIAVGCGGGKKTINVGDGKVQVGGSLPSDFPKDFPVYKGANFQGSYTSTQEGITGTAVSWETGDSPDKVKSFYESAFKDGPWKSSTTGSAGDGAFWVATSSDGKKAAYVFVSTASGKTSIVATVGDNPEASSGTPEATATSESTSNDTPTSGGDETPAANATLPAEATLSSDFPTNRVPFPSGARVTSTSSVSSGGTKTFYVELYVKDTPANVNDYFKNEVPKKGWTEALSSESGGQYFLTFSSSGGATDEAVTVTVEQSETAGYALVSLAVVVKA